MNQRVNQIGIFFLGLVLWGLTTWAEASQGVPLTLFHTNDLHSHFRSELTGDHRGGIARLKTLVDSQRKLFPSSLLLDGGDWSEGSIYYTDGLGEQSLRMMDALGYDATVVGNHDWLNGPDALLDSINRVQPKMSLVTANLELRNYSRSEEFRKNIPPYVIREVNGLKVAIIGIATYEWIYDKFLKPVQITEPFINIRDLAARLKPTVDVVVAISHNSISMNQGILKAASSVDVIIGAHDHKLLEEPLLVNRWGGSPGWIVEAGSWGRYLGRLNLNVDQGQVTVMDYQLLPVNQNTPENPEILKAVDQMEARISKQFGAIFVNPIASSELELGREGMESPMGDLVTDSYRHATGADFALESTAFVAGEIHRGNLTTADFFNIIPAVFNSETGKTWTLKTLPLSGRTLRLLLNLLYSTKKLGTLGLLSVSNLEFIFDPLFLMNRTTMPSILAEPQAPRIESIPMVSDIRVEGQPLDPDATYTVALGQGIVEAIDFVNQHIKNIISLDELRDTGIESWKVLADYVKRLSPLTRKHLILGNRVRTLQSDLGFYEGDVQVFPLDLTSSPKRFKIDARVSNFGAQATDGSSATLHILHSSGYIRKGEMTHEEWGNSQPIPALKPGASTLISWEIQVSDDEIRSGARVQIQGNDSEVNHTNDELDVRL